MSETRLENELTYILKNLDFDFRQNLIINGPPPSLKFISLSNIVTSLWHEEVKFADFGFIKYMPTWWHIYNKVNLLLNSLENKITNRVANLEIPVHCKDDLKLIVSSVKNELFKYFYFYLYNHSIIDKLKVFLNNICWTQQGTINFLKTATKIIDHSDLSIRDKYEFACHQCLEEKIRDLHNILPENIIEEFEDDKKPFTWSFFWTSYIKNEEMPVLIKEEPALDFLLEYAISQENAISVQYIWEKFANEAVKERLMEFANLEKRKLVPNVSFYFAKQMNQVQLKEASPNIHRGLLFKLHSISRCYNGLPALKDIIELTKTNNINHDFEVMIFCWLENLLEVEKFLNIWSEFFLRFKDHIEYKMLDLYKIIHNRYCAVERQIIASILLIKMATPDNKLKLIYSDITLHYCDMLIVDEGFKIFHSFLKNILETNQLLHYKEYFFEAKSFEICSSLIKDNKYEELDEILIELCSKENIKGFKRKLVYQFDAYIFFMVSETDDEIDFILALNKYLNWCFDGDTKEMKNCMRNVFDIESNLYSDLRIRFFERINYLITQRKWNLVEKHCQWFFYSTEENITTSKDKLKRIKKILLLMNGNLCFLTYIKTTYSHVQLKRFIDFCFNQDEIEELKEELKINNDLTLLVIELLKREEFSEANNLLDWCYSSDKNNIYDFKVTLMKLNGCSVMFEFIKSDTNTENNNFLLEWFNPSAELENKFKEQFIEYVSHKMKTLSENNAFEEENPDMESDCTMFNERVN